MGRNSKARRDARRRANPHASAAGAAAFGFGGAHRSRQEYAGDRAAVASLFLARQVNRMGLRDSDADVAARVGRIRRDVASASLLSPALRDLLDGTLDPVLRGGWGPDDLADAAERFVGSGSRPLLAGALLRARRRGVRTDEAFDRAAASLGGSRELDVSSDADLAAALRLVRLLASLPCSEQLPTEVTSAPRPKDDKAAAKLAQVRALLAKAEATPFPEEAETLSAKAQELVSRYSLEHLLAQATRGHTSEIEHRRFWLDAPYVDAKANLVDNVARANGCRTVYSATLAMSTLVGAPFDLDAVEMLTTSLMAQAQIAMLAHGSASDLAGRSRTRSFRQSFLLSFAIHIGDRLRDSAQEAVQASGRSTSLVPALRAREEEVDALTEQLFPQLQVKETRISNMAGWAGGKAAAQLATLDLRGSLADG